jgi:hypothetical protein
MEKLAASGSTEGDFMVTTKTSRFFAKTIPFPATGATADVEALLAFVSFTSALETETKTTEQMEGKLTFFFLPSFSSFS